MSNKVYFLLTVLLFFAGAGLLAYPAVSNYIIEKSQGEVISSYQESIDNLDKKEIEAIREQAQEYNESLIGQVVLTDPFEADDEEGEKLHYQTLLNPNQDGVMGYVAIPKISVFLPIYHGTDASVMERGAGHLMNTSLPIGGKGTHAVLSAHAGLPAAKLFTDLNQLEIGDQFSLSVLGEELEYEIDQIKIVEPEDTTDLFIDIEKDYTTLVTCTPYGINSHRLLVRGVRTYQTEGESIQQEAKASYWSPWIWAYIIVIPIVAVFIGFVLIRRKLKKKHEK